MEEMRLTKKEIYGQYDALKKTIALFDEKKDMLAAIISEKKPRAILFTGCGSSFSLSCSFRSTASMRADIPVYAAASGDLWLNCDRYEKMLTDALVVSVSRSGRTSEVIRAYEAIAALNCGARFLSIICAEDTPVEKMSDYVLKMPWAFDNSVCQTRCVSNLFAMGTMMIDTMFGDGSIREGMAKVAACGPAYLEKYDALAREIAGKDWDHAVVLADGEIDGLAEEGALAYKEISQLNSNYYHLLDVRHGPMVLIGKRTLVVAAVKSPACPYEMALVDDAINKGAAVICYSQKEIEKEGATNVALGENVGYVAGGLGLVALCQLITYYKSQVVGCDPDQPDGLDAWIEIK